MNLEITQDNLHLILPGKLSWMAQMYSAEKNVSAVEALTYIYGSETYRQLEKEDTKLWHYGPVALYQMLMEEKAHC